MIVISSEQNLGYGPYIFFNLPVDICKPNIR